MVLTFVFCQGLPKKCLNTNVRNGWDVAGAKAAGMQTAFVARPGKALYPLAQAPDYVVKDLNELVVALRQR